MANLDSMRQLKTYCPIFLAMLMFSSCFVSGPQISLYGPAMYSNDISYQPKPISSDSVRSAGYLSLAYFSGNAANTNNSFDMTTGGQLNIGHAVTFSDFSLSYGAFGTIGNYNNQTASNANHPGYFSDKSFGSAGGRFSGNAFVNSGNVDIRFIGFEMAYSHEFGDYADFRKSITGQPNYFSDTHTDIITIGGSSEVIWRSRRQPMQFGFRLFIGRTLGDNAYRNPATPLQVYYPDVNTVSMAYFIQFKKVFLVSELHTNGGEFRLGLRF